MDRDTAFELAEYLARETPGDGLGGWDDEATSAFEDSLDMLEAFGYAEPRFGRCAGRIQGPQLPAVLPRHDDSCVVLIGLAHQRGRIEFRKPGDEAGARIQPGPGTWAADAADDVVGLLERLGIIEGGAWTAAAEMVLWRTWPYHWPMPDFASDARVALAIERSRDFPDDVQQPVEEAEAQTSPQLRRYYLQWLVSDRWRMADGWISQAPGDPPAVGSSHDPLAQHVSRALFGVSL